MSRNNYDNVCKIIAEQFTDELASWLLGYPVSLSQLSPTELSLEPIRADNLSLQQSNDLILHVEFQTKPNPKIPFRMADYRLRAYRKFPEKEMHQVVIYLKRIKSPLVLENSFVLSRTSHEFDVIRLWEQPPEIFLNSVGLLPFAALSNTENPREILEQVSVAIEEIADTQEQSNVAGLSAILAGLVLDPEVVNQILRRDIMQESAVYQDILREGREEGVQQGIKQGLKKGIQQGLEQVANSLLLTGMSLEEVAKLTGLPLERVQSLRDNLNNN